VLLNQRDHARIVRAITFANPIRISSIAVTPNALRRAGIDVTTTADANLRTAEDMAQLEYVKQSGASW
jgi:hypothetical protein